MTDLSELLARIARRDATRSEATLQADVRQLLLTAPLSLTEGDLATVDLETPVGVRRRIDVEAGSCLVEIKRDLSVGSVLTDATEQLAGYLRSRQTETGCRYVGLLTDGTDWRCVTLVGAEGPPREVSAHVLTPAGPAVESFLVWLEGVLATARDVPATPREIERRLGAASSAHALDRATLADLFDRHRDHPAVAMKRRLWARLLTTALGTQFEDDDDLFVEHTYLVNTAEIIAHAVVGLDAVTIAPASLLSGAKFEEGGIAGVVEADFFDWPAQVPEGERFVRSLARRVARFRWDAVGGDVLKVLYESVIGAATRKRLGEYYTPDWLAERVVAETVPEPLTTRVLDPACGSGTFLFHCVRGYLDAADAAGLSAADALAGLTRHVLGLDLHPVAVTLARVTYLLAIGRDRLTDRARGRIEVPVYLGDAVQWQRTTGGLFSKGNLVVETDDRKQLFESELKFPEALLENPARFNGLVEALTGRASDRAPGGPRPKLDGLFQRFAVAPADRPALTDTFAALCELHDAGRDHIWGYYVRNLARPYWLARPDNRVDAIVGNPPWLTYRFMTPAMQQTFKAYSEDRGLWHGAKVATQQDLSGLFLVRAVGRYLRTGGRFGLVMPNAAVDRGQFRGLRTGSYRGLHNAAVLVAFDRAWDLRRVRPHFFPRGSAVLFGRRSDENAGARPLPTDLIAFSGKLPAKNGSWAEVEPHLTRAPGEAKPVADGHASPWADRFRNGANLYPRMLFFVTRREAGPLGMPAGQAAVRSLQRSNDKPPWKGLPPLEGVVETEFLRPVLLGECVLPYRVRSTFEAVIPRDTDGLMSVESERLDAHPGLADWWRRAERAMAEQNPAGLSLLEQIDYHGKFEQQLPIPPHRIVYNSSGMHLLAARVNDSRAVVENTLIWATAASDEEASFLCAVLNSAGVTELVRPYMSYGKDERHISKSVWQLPVPLYDPSNDLHAALAARGAELEAAVADLEIDPDRHFTTVRRDVRAFLADADAGRDVEELVVELLG